MNEEGRRREWVIRVFPNDESALRLIGVLLAISNSVQHVMMSCVCAMG